MSNFFCDYEIIGELGRGGMSIVYRAKNRRGESVALKKLLPSLTADPNLVERFKRAPEMYPRHPSIIPILDSGVCNDTPYYVMELIEGFTLEKSVKEAGFLTPEHLAPVLRSIALGLDAIHAKGLIHRDIKPSNVLIRKSDGHVYLTDLDIARNTMRSMLTTTGALVGTADYMSPEQAHGGKDLTFASDVYSLGVLAYQALSGRVPFKADSVMAVMRMHMQDMPLPLDKVNSKVTSRVSKIVMKALEKQPEKRYPNAGAFASAFAEALKEPQKSSRQSALIPLAVLGVLIVAGLGGIALAAGANNSEQGATTLVATDILPTLKPTTQLPTLMPEKTIAPSPISSVTSTPAKSIITPTATLAPELPTLTPTITRLPPTRILISPTPSPSRTTVLPSTATPAPSNGGGGNQPQPTSAPLPTSAPAPTNPPPTNVPPTPSK